MAKRKEDPPKAGSPAWMSTFSDLMNLLLCFFIMLFASSTIDAEKLQQVAASFTKNNIFNAGATAIGDGKLVSSGVKQLSVLDNYVSSLGRNEQGTSSNLSDVKEQAEKPIDAESTTAAQIVNDVNEQPDSKEQSASSGQASKTSEQVQTSQNQTAESQQELQQQVEETGYMQSEQMNEEIEKMLETSKISEQVSMDYTAQYVQLSLNGGILFESGNAELTKDAQKLIGKLGAILEKYKNRTIEIEGHTDNVPINSGEYKNNQYLSSARAISVYEYLLEHSNLIASNMKHSGYGDKKPIASNKTAAGRCKNRRVEIKIYNKISSESN